ncbi:MAG: hypothetical protein HY271_16305 [Deltaproteobacteria bacterium]|nr:hypothetical protein [Deltaproteobacteria bacterium]
MSLVVTPHRRRAASVLAAVLLALAAATGCARPRVSSAPAPDRTMRQFTFAWRYAPGELVAPRGGTTQGPAVTLDTEPGDAWRRLQDPTLRPLEHDRRAILAMAGTYRVSFDFLEVVGFRPGFVPDRPYQSWGSEYVYVRRDQPRFISLQHILVMFVRVEDGSVQGPFVTKHWRQDWRYQDRDLLTYRGHDTWAKERRSAAQAKGTWTQAVFQVDDSPRYEAFGRWEHFGNVSTWRSSTTWRPLPRREFSVRGDYDVLIGTNRVSITPTGWVQEEENLKVALDERGRPIVTLPVLAQEIGLNRYERLKDFDDSAARQYRDRTEPFWNAVRTAWNDIIASHRRFTLRVAPDRGQLFVPLFTYAERLADGTPFDRVAAVTFARKQVRAYLRADAPPAAPRR